MTLYVILANIVLIHLFSVRLFEEFRLFPFFVLAVPITFYLPLCEYFWNGKTVGKYFVKMRVMHIDGSAATLGDITLRWLLRTIDIKLGFLFIFFIPKSSNSEVAEYIIGLIYFFMIFPMPVVGILFMLLTKKNQRVGDLVANTVVVRNTRPLSLDDTILRKTEVNYQPVFANALDLSDRDIYIIKNVLDSYKNTKNRKVVNDLAIKAREILKIKEKIEPVALLQTLVKDYNHLAKKKDEV
jgi:uncharacterized RDD family membrane protein YckC